MRFQVEPVQLMHQSGASFQLTRTVSGHWSPYLIRGISVAGFLQKEAASPSSGTSGDRLVMMHSSQRQTAH